MKTRDIFVSHAWSYSDSYIGVVRLLDKASYFKWRNYSVPEHDPAVDPMKPVGKNKLTALLSEQIRQSSCFVVVAGMYVNHKEWIQTEIEIAQNYEKPIIGVRSRGQKITPKCIQDVADEICNWNAKSITDAIKRVC